jgi:hypothetical protein
MQRETKQVAALHQHVSQLSLDESEKFADTFFVRIAY